MTGTVVRARHASLAPTWGTLGQDTQRCDADARSLVDGALANVARDAPIDELVINAGTTSAILAAIRATCSGLS